MARLNVAALLAEVDAAKRVGKLTWVDVAETSGIPYGRLHRFVGSRNRGVVPSGDTLILMLQWLGYHNIAHLISKDGS